MIFNGIEKDYLTVLRGRKRPVITKIDHDMEKGRIRRTKLEALEIIVPILIEVPKGYTLEEIKEEISGWLFHYEDKRLFFKDNPDRYYMARLQEIDLDDHCRYADGDIKFICQKPYRFGKSKELTIGTSSAYHNIKGQTETPWTSRTVFKKSADQFFIKGAYGRNVTLNYNFIEGDVLEIDYDTRDVFLNGDDLAVSVSLQTDWFDLPVGNVRLEASHETTLKYDERYY